MVETTNLNQAALLLTIGAKLVHIYPNQPTWRFVFEVKLWQRWYEKHIGIVSYKKFCKSRGYLKSRAYRGTPFRGKDDSFMFNDLVRVVKWHDRL